MKKSTFILFLITALIFAVSLAGPVEQVAYAAPAMHGGHGGVGGGGGHVGRSSGRGFGGRGGNFGHGGHFEGGIWIGPGFGIWDPFYYPFYYPYYPYPSYSAPTTVVPEEQEYSAPMPQQGETGYWYYCREANGYYPYVKSCPSGWMRVVPSPSPRD